MILSPPVIVEELSVCSKNIRLRGQLRGAKVAAFVDGNPTPIMEATAEWPDQWFALTGAVALHPGDVVRASQQLGADTSVLSSEPVSVQDRSISTPVFAAPLVGCSTIAVVESLAPGAHVHVEDASNSGIGDADSAGSRVVVTLTRNVGNGEILHAQSDACGAPGGGIISSLPAEPMRGAQPKLDAPALGGAMECQRVLHFTNTRVGAILQLERESGTIFWTCSASELNGRIDPPLVKDERLVFWQEPPTRSCEAENSDKVTVTVVGGPPGPPRISTRPCPGSRWIVVHDLVPSATVKVFADATEVCVFEAAEASQEVDLGGAVLVPGQKLTVAQGLCGVFGAASPVPSWVTKPPLESVPRFPEQLFSCASIVRVSGLAGASRVSIYSDRLKGRIGFGFADDESIDIEVHPPLIEPDRIYASVTGCAGGTAAREVEPMRDLPPFFVAEPTEDDISVLVQNLIPGCTVDVIVDQHWAGGTRCAAKETRVRLTKALKTNQQVTVYARMCTQVRKANPVTVKPPLKVSWSRPTPLGLLMNSGHYASGRVQAALALPGRLLLGTEEGGVWVMSAGGIAMPLSLDWPNPTVRSLARGTRGDEHIYCGTTNGVMETDPTQPVPLFSWRRVNGIPAVAGVGPGTTINDILVLPARSLIFVATNAGLWWSSVPATTGIGYVWSTDPVVSGANVLSICEGPGDSVVGYGINAMGGGFVRGEWVGANLQWTNTTPGASGAVSDARLTTVVSRMANGHVASCASDRTRMVAGVADQPVGNNLTAWLAVLLSDDGGKTWSIPYTDANLQQFKPGVGIVDMGFQAERNLRVAVHPKDKKRIVIAGRRTGLFGSEDGGVTWDVSVWPAVMDESFHADCLCMVFDASDPSGNTMVIGSDGGAYVSTDFGKTWDDSNNRTLSTLMFDQQIWSAAPAMSASERFPGLIVGAFQDNGKGYLSADGEPWRELGRVGDGQRALFVTGDIVMNGGNDDADLRWARWDGAKFVDEVTLEPPNYPAGLQFMPFMARIPYPSTKDQASGALMIAVAGDNQAGGNVYGLYDRGPAHNPASDRLYWMTVGTVPFQITAIATLTGKLILVGTTGTHAYLLDPGTGTVVETTMPPGLASDAIRWISLGGSSLAFALVQNTLLRTLDMATWSVVGTPGGTICNVITVDRAVDPVRLFLGGSDGVWSSRDLGATWVATSGQPRHPQANHLEVVEYASGGRVINMGTWNWSVWRAQLG